MVSELFAEKPHDSKPESFLKAGLKTQDHQCQNRVSKSAHMNKEAIKLIIVA